MNNLLRLIIFFLLMIPNSFGELLVEFVGDTVLLWDKEVFSHCAAVFMVDLSLSNDTIFINEHDTTRIMADCNCYFDLSVAFDSLAPGDYTAMFYRTDLFSWGYDTTFFIGSLTFSVEGESHNGFFIKESHSDCLWSERDSLSEYWVEVNGDIITFGWDNAYLNCCMEPCWNSDLRNDTLYVTFEDTTSNPCFCNCYFNLRADFGPFLPGDYILIFDAEDFEPLHFTIQGNGISNTDYLYTQSDCYSLGAVEDSRSQLPEEFGLINNYPNPFNQTTVIGFNIPQPTDVNLSIVDLTGHEVCSILSDFLDRGYHEVLWDAEDYSSGIYFVILRAWDKTDISKLILLK